MRQRILAGISREIQGVREFRFQECFERDSLIVRSHRAGRRCAGKLRDPRIDFR